MLVDKIEVGETTKEEIMYMFGVPLKKEKKEKYIESWNYNYIVTKKGINRFFYKPVEKKL